MIVAQCEEKGAIGFLRGKTILILWDIFVLG